MTELTKGNAMTHAGAYVRARIDTNTKQRGLASGAPAHMLEDAAAGRCQNGAKREDTARYFLDIARTASR